MRPASIARLALFAWLGLAAPRSAMASGQGDAQRLFDEAQKLRERGKYDEACPKLERSQELEPAVGTLLYLADCYEQTGRKPLAWRSFRQAEREARQAGQVERAELAARAMAGLERTLGRIVLRPGDAAPELRIWLDRVELDRRDWGDPIFVDPGPHLVEAGLGEEPSWSRRVDTVAADEPIVVAIPPRAATLTGDASADDGQGGARLGAQEIAALVVGSVGVAALAVGIGVGVDARNVYSDSDEYCDADDVCQPEGIRLRDRAQSQALGADITLVAGGVLMAAGVVLWLTAPSDDDAEDEPSEAAFRWRIVPAVSGARLVGVW